MKNKTVLIIVITILSVSAAVFFLKTGGYKLDKDTAYICVVGPFSGKEREYGVSMARGVRMFIDEANEKELLEGKKIEMITGDDRNEKRNAVRVASDIANNGRVLVVLGHYYSDASIAAGEIYKKYGVPAITASSTAEEVTKDNSWYFSVIPDNGQMVRFIGHHIKYPMAKNSVSIVYDRDSYGSSLLRQFEETASEIGIRINKKWGFDTWGQDLEDRLSEIIAAIRSMEDPGVLFFATHSSEAVKIITSLKYPGSHYSIIGPDSFTNSMFIEDFKKYPGERTIPGYYSDNIYSATPILIDIAGEKGRNFKRAFMERYHKKPTWVAACYYNAAAIAVEAMELAEVQGRARIREDRRSIRDILANIDNYDVGIEGIGGRIYFDSTGKSKKELSMGVYQNQKLLPSFSQYHNISDRSEEKRTFRKSVPGNILVIDDQTFAETNIVYVGIDINSISDVNPKESTCTMDFYLWFRFKGGFKPENIKFTNAVEPIMPANPVFSQNIDGVSTIAYKIKADFRSNFDFEKYPFDNQYLGFGFHHTYRPASKLQFFPDNRGMFRADNLNTRKKNISIISGWAVEKVSFYHNVLSIAPTIGNSPINFSRFNANVHIRKKGYSTKIKKMFPVLVITALLYAVFFMPSDRPAIRMPFIIAILTVAVGYHLTLRHGLPSKGLLTLEYGLFAIYAAVLWAFVFSLAAWRFHSRGDGRRAASWARIGRIVYPAVVLATGTAMAFIFNAG